MIGREQSASSRLVSPLCYQLLLYRCLHYVRVDHRSASRLALARDLGLLCEEKLSAGELAQRRREQARLAATAEMLERAELRTLLAARGDLLRLHSLRRQAGARLAALREGAAERFPGEAALAWETLKLVADSELRAVAAYAVAAFSSPAERVRFALRAHERAAMISGALESGAVIDDRGRRMEVSS